MKFRKFKMATVVLLVSACMVSAFAQNLVKGGDMEDPSAWNSLNHKGLTQPTFEGGDMEDPSAWNSLNHKGLTQPTFEFSDVGSTIKFGSGQALKVTVDPAAATESRLMLWQPVTLIAGQTYRATGAISCTRFDGAPEGGGAWYQLYVDPLEVDESADDWDPAAGKLLDINGWQDNFPETFDGLWESGQWGSSAVPTSPYYVPAGTPGEEVELTFAIKWGQ